MSSMGFKMGVHAEPEFGLTKKRHMTRLTKADAEIEFRTNRKIGHRISIVRSASGISLAQVSESMGISVSQLSRHESGEVPVSVGRLLRICRALDVLPAQLLEGIVEPVGEQDETDLGLQFGRILGRLPQPKRLVVFALLREMAR